MKRSKLIFLILILIISSGMVFANGGTEDEQCEGVCILGDINGDQFLIELDFIMLINYILGFGSPNFEFLCADVNGDIELDIHDVLMIIELIDSCGDGVCEGYQETSET